MAFKYADRVKETSVTTGTGNVTLAGAVSGFRTFASQFANTDTLFYAITDQNGANWEVGLGTFVSATPALARTSVIASSNANAAVNFTSGALFVFCDLPASAIAIVANGKVFTVQNTITVSGVDGSTLAVPSAASVSGTNTGDQTTVTGNAGTATALQNARLIGGVSFNGTADITPQNVQVADAASDTTTFPVLAGSATGNLQMLTDPGLSYNASTNILTSGGFAGSGGTGFTLAIASATITGDLAFSNIAQLAANTVACNPTASLADISSIALSASNLFGRGSTGNAAAITVAGGLSFSGTVLSSADTNNYIARAYAEYATNAALTTAIPVDDTIPQITEGTEILSLSVTTVNASDRVRISFAGFGGVTNASGNVPVAALFRDAGVNALQVSTGALMETDLQADFSPLTFQFEEAPGVGTFTYRVRVGPGSGTLRMNGKSGSRFFGGASKSTMIGEVIAA